MSLREKIAYQSSQRTLLYAQEEKGLSKSESKYINRMAVNKVGNITSQQTLKMFLSSNEQNGN